MATQGEKVNLVDKASEKRQAQTLLIQSKFGENC